MPVTNENPAPSVVSALLKGLSGIGRPLPDDAAIHGNHVFSIGLQKLASAGTSARDAQPSGWQFRIRQGKSTIIADVSEPVSPGPKLTRVTEGRIVNETSDALDRVTKLPDTATSDFQLRIIRFHGLRTEAFWLRPANGSGDLFVPYLTLSPRLPRGRVFRGPEFFAIVAELATKQLSLPDQTSEPRQSSR